MSCTVLNLWDGSGTLLTLVLVLPSASLTFVLLRKAAQADACPAAARGRSLGISGQVGGPA